MDDSPRRRGKIQNIYLQYQMSCFNLLKPPEEAGKLYRRATPKAIPRADGVPAPPAIPALSRRYLSTTRAGYQEALSGNTAQ
jgi:hypothetical protein